MPLLVLWFPTLSQLWYDIIHYCRSFVPFHLPCRASQPPAAVLRLPSPQVRSVRHAAVGKTTAPRRSAPSPSVPWSAAGHRHALGGSLGLSMGCLRAGPALPARSVRGRWPPLRPRTPYPSVVRSAVTPCRPGVAMRRDPPAQLPLGLDGFTPEDEGPRRRRHRTFRKPLRGLRPPPQVANVRLSQRPLDVKCGLCGRKVTIHSDAAACPVCRTIVRRPADDEGEEELR